MNRDMLKVSKASKATFCNIIGLVVVITAVALALGAVYLTTVDALVSLTYGVPYQNAGLSFVQNATIPSLGTASNLLLVAMSFPLLALATRWFLLEASSHSGSSQKTRVRRLIILAVKLCSLNSLVNRRLMRLAGVMSHTTPNLVLLSTSAGLAGAIPLLN